MKIKITTGLAAILLLGISCTKEQQSTSSFVSAQTQGDIATLRTHRIGQHFAGGIIFYLDSTGQHGLIADTADLGELPWWNGFYMRTGATGTNIGTGKANTHKIISKQGETGSYAALACANSVRNGYSDWFLPSFDELIQLAAQQSVVGGFVPNRWYWSSSESGNRQAWLVIVTNSFNKGPHKKSGTQFVRAIRSF